MNDTVQRRILIAEDNAALASVVRFTLERAGFDVTVACNGQAAWDLVQTDEFDLIVTDQQMPLMTGVEFCYRLRSLPAYQDVPVVMLTAKGLELDMAELRDRLGITNTLPKPFSPGHLADLVESYLAATPTR